MKKKQKKYKRDQNKSRLHTNIPVTQQSFTVTNSCILKLFPVFDFVRHNIKYRSHFTCPPNSLLLCSTQPQTNQVIDKRVQGLIEPPKPFNNFSVTALIRGFALHFCNVTHFNLFMSNAKSLEVINPSTR